MSVSGSAASSLTDTEADVFPFPYIAYRLVPRCVPDALEEHAAYIRHLQRLEGTSAAPTIAVARSH